MRDLAARSRHSFPMYHPRKNGAPLTKGGHRHRTTTPVALALGGLAALAAGMGVGRFVYTPILPAMIEGLSLTKAEAGLIASANFLGYLIGALVAASPRMPGTRRAWLLGSLTFGAATTGAMGLASSLPAFLVLRCAGGAASAFVLIFASALVFDRLAEVNRGGLSVLHFAGVGIGIALSAVVVSALLAFGADWRVLWFAAGAASLAVVPAVAWLVPEHASSPSIAPPAHSGGGAPGRGLAALTWAYCLFGFGYVVTATFLVAIVRANSEVRPIEPWIWIVVGLTAAPSVALWGWLGTSTAAQRF